MSRRWIFRLATLILWSMTVLVAWFTWKTVQSHWDEGASVEFRAPGVAMFNAKSIGSYNLWLVTRGQFGDTLVQFPEKLPESVVLSIHHEESGKRLPLRRAGGVEMEVDGAHRILVASVEITKVGNYRLEVSGLDTPFLFYFGKSHIFALLRDSLLGLAAMITMVLGGIIFLICSFIVKDKSRNSDLQ